MPADPIPRFRAWRFWSVPLAIALDIAAFTVAYYTNEYMFPSILSVFILSVVNWNEFRIIFESQDPRVQHLLSEKFVRRAWASNMKSLRLFVTIGLILIGLMRGAAPESLHPNAMWLLLVGLITPTVLMVFSGHTVRIFVEDAEATRPIPAAA